MVQARILGVETLKKFAFARLMPVGYRMADLKFQNKKPGLLLRALHVWAEWVLLKPIRKSLGLANARICYSTGAMLSPEALRFYQALDLPLKSIYSTTEGGVASGNRTGDIRPETVGPVLPGREVKITAEGEIAHRQPGLFLGYYKAQGETEAVLKNGWFYSGDSGFLKEDEHLVFIDRLSDLIELQNGEKLAPQLLESRLRSSPFIKEAWVLAGPDKAYASVIVVINYNTVSRWAGQRKIAFRTLAELSQKPEVSALVKDEIDRINRTLPPGCRLKKYVNLHQEFDPDEDELTRTMNLRRPFLEKHYRELIEAVYADKTEVTIETPVKHRDGRIETIKTTLGIRSGERTGS
jgi:long-chain acyl-CoA synthetase